MSQYDSLPSCDRISHKRAILEMVDRHCRRLLAEGGGGLPREVPHAGRPVPQDEQAIWLEMATEGRTAYGIAKERGWAKSTVRKFMRRFVQEGRLAPLPRRQRRLALAV